MPILIIVGKSSSVESSVGSKSACRFTSSATSSSATTTTASKVSTSSARRHYPVYQKISICWNVIKCQEFGQVAPKSLSASNKKMVKKSYEATFSLALSSHGLVGFSAQTPRTVLSHILARTTPAASRQTCNSSKSAKFVIGQVRESDPRRPGPAHPFLRRHLHSSPNSFSFKVAHYGRCCF